MHDFFEFLESHFTLFINYLILVVEVIGVCILVFATVRALYELFRHKGAVKLDLAEGIGLALEFKMVGELLRTVVVRDLEELAILGIVIVLRAAIAFLVHWEIANEKKAETKSDLVATFLALLELIKSKRISVEGEGEEQQVQMRPPEEWDTTVPEEFDEENESTEVLTDGN